MANYNIRHQLLLVIISWISTPLEARPTDKIPRAPDTFEKKMKAGYD